MTLTFQWPQPVAVAELVYFGRTAWQWEENWKNYEVYVESAEKPIHSGELLPGHGPQRIRLPEPVTASALTLKFLSSYGGSNPGAAEIQVFGAPLPDAAYASFTPPVRAPAPPAIVESKLPESGSLAARLARGGLGFTRLGGGAAPVDRPDACLHLPRGRTEAGWRAVCCRAVGRDAAPTQLVDASEGLILDANVSYDGNTVLFSWKKTMQDKLQLFTINVDGTQLAQHRSRIEQPERLLAAR